MNETECDAIADFAKPHSFGIGDIHHREFAMAAGEMTEHEFTEFLFQTFGLLRDNSKSGSVHFICMDWRHASELLVAGKRTYDEYLNLCVWAKDNGGMGSLYRSQHELVFVFRNGKEQHRNTSDWVSTVAIAPTFGITQA